MTQRGDADLLSIAMPVYNGLPYLPQAIESVLAQTDHRWRLIIADDGSSDGSVESLAPYLGDSRVELLSNHRPSVSWWTPTSLALSTVRTEWAQILHQDDRLAPTRVEEILRFAGEHPECDLLYSSAALIGESGQRLGALRSPHRRGSYVQPGHDELRRLVVQNYIAVPAAAFRMEALREVGTPDERLWFTGDWDLWLRLAARPSASVGYLDRELSQFRLQRHSQTHQRGRDADALLHQLQEVSERALRSAPLEVKAQRRLVDANRALNLALASLAGGSPGTAARWAFKLLVTLYPWQYPELIRDSQVVPRCVSRVRARLPVSGSARSEPSAVARTRS